MSEPDYKGRVLLPMPVIEAARAEDAEAVERVLRYYEGYINKLCTRTLTKKARKITAAQHRATDTFCMRRIGGCAMTPHPAGEREPPTPKAGSL